MAHEWECDTAEIGTAAKARDNRVGIFTGHFHLFLGFQPDDGLMQGDVAQYRPERVFAIRGRACQFDGFRDGRTQRTLIVRVLGQDVLARTGGHGGRSGDLRAERLHDAAAVGLLLVTDFDLIDSRFQPEHLGGVGEGCSPLARAGFCRYVRHALLLAVVSLCQCRVQFVRADRADAFVLEVYMGRCPQSLFQSVGPYERCAPVVFVHFAHFLGNLYPRVRLVQLLPAQFFRKNRIQVFRFQRLLGGRIEWRHGFVHHVGLNVIPIARDVLFCQKISFFLFHNAYCV